MQLFIACNISVTLITQYCNKTVKTLKL